MRSLIIGASTGYGFKLVQALCSLLLVPFLIQNSKLGLAGYGEVVTLISAVALFPTLLDGFRQVVARRLGSNISKVYEKWVPFMLLPLLLGVFVLCILSPLISTILSLVGLNSIAPWIAFVVFASAVIDQMVYVIEQVFHTNRKTWIINLIGTVEVVARTSALVLIFSMNQATVGSYFVIIMIFGMGKLFVQIWVVVWTGGLNGQDLLVRIISQRDALVEAIPLTLKGIATYLVFRLTVVIANKGFDSETAGVVSILVFTIRNHIFQLFLSAIRPMVIPVVAGLNITKLDKETRSVFVNSVELYQFIVVTCCLTIGFFVPIWLPLWLQRPMDTYLVTFSVGIIFFGLEAAVSVKNLILVSQGYGPYLARYAVISAIIYFLTMMSVSSAGILTPLTISILLAIYVVSYCGIAVAGLYRKAIGIVGSIDYVMTPLSLVTVLVLYLSILPNLESTFFQLVKSLSLVGGFIISQHLLVREIGQVNHYFFQKFMSKFGF